MESTKAKILHISYIVGSILLVLYSFTQVDLGLTLTRSGILHNIQTTFQHVGYFQRPVSSLLSGLIILYFFILFLFTIRLVRLQAISRTTIWKIILTTSTILLMSYPAFSYDIFNYMFTAKTVLLYQKNPYEVVPLNFAGVDPWLGFMHWTHAGSAYPPVWILLTLLPYVFGFGTFLLILFNFKLLILICYLLSVFCIEKILESLDQHHSLTGITLFALNPLVIFEILVSGHNDIALIAFVLLAYILAIKKRLLLSVWSLAMSVAIKTSSIVLFPLYLWKWQRSHFLIFSIISLVILTIVIERTGRDLQPWHFLLIICASSLFPKSKNLQVAILCLSIGLLLQYIPYLYFGHWNTPVPALKTFILIGALSPAALIFCKNGYIQLRNHKL